MISITQCEIFVNELTAKESEVEALKEFVTMEIFKVEVARLQRGLYADELQCCKLVIQKQLLEIRRRSREKGPRIV